MDKEKRTSRQNRYYWHLVKRITRHIYSDKGWTEHDTHRYIKSRFFVDRDELMDIMDRILLYDDPFDILTDIVELWDKSSTTNSDTKAWEDKMHAIRMYYDSQGLYLPLPNEPDYEEMQNMF